MLAVTWRKVEQWLLWSFGGVGIRWHTGIRGGRGRRTFRHGAVLAVTKKPTTTWTVRMGRRTTYSFMSYITVNLPWNSESVVYVACRRIPISYSSHKSDVEWRRERRWYLLYYLLHTNFKPPSSLQLLTWRDEQDTRKVGWVQIVL